MRKSLSQQKLLEILIAEIELLQQTSKHIKEVAPEIARQLEKVKNSGIKAELNTERLEWLLANHEKLLKKSINIPIWFFWMVVLVIIGLMALCFIVLFLR